MKLLVFLILVSSSVFISSNELCYDLFAKGTSEKIINEELETNLGKYLNEVG
jgi:hypothetical protein